MSSRLKQGVHRRRNRLRKQTVEPVLGQIDGREASGNSTGAG